MNSNKAINRLDSANQAVRILGITCIALVILLIHAHIKVVNVPKEYTFWTPPDLTKGGFANINEPQDIHVLNFALVIHTNLNSWRENGQVEFPKAVDQHRNYLSEPYYKLLKSRAASAGNSYRGRERVVQFNYQKNNHFNVENKGNGKWFVTILMRVTDSVANNTIKDEYVKYSLVVEKVHFPRTVNPFGLSVSGEFANSSRVQ